MGRPPSKDQDKFIVRLPDGMRDQIADAARKANRSMTAEIVARLEASFALGITTYDNGFDVPGSTGGPTEIEKRLEEVEARLAALESKIS